MRHRVSTLTIVLTVTSLLFAGGSNDPASACECAPPLTPLEELERSAAVFSGKVIAITKNPSEYDKEVKFDVERSWKGSSSKTVTVFTGDPSAICGYDFQEDEKYLVYAHPTEGFLYTSGCFGTKPLANAQEDLNVLGAEWKIYKADVDDHVFKIPYRTAQAEIKEILADVDFASIIATLETRSDGTIEIAVPRNLIDARFDMGAGEDDEFIVLVDGEEETYEEVKKSPCFRTLLIPFPSDAENIEIIATTILGAGDVGTLPPKPEVPPVFVYADKYNDRTREIIISGCTNLALDKKEVLLEVINPEGETHQTLSVTPNRDGSFSTPIFVYGVQAINGTYTLKATYADYTYTYVPEFPISLIILGISFVGVLVAARLFSSTNKHNVY